MKASHVEYLVSTRSSLEGWSPAEASVRRRFKDFVALADVLKARFRGYFVPPRPEKNAVEGQRMSDAFIEDRRSSLEKYLRKLASHPVIGPSEELKLFLTITDDLAISYQWQSMQPPSATVMESTAKFGMQLIGRESKVVDPVAAAQPAAAGAFVAAAAAAFAVLHAVLPTRSECLQLTCECAAASQPALQLKEQPCPAVQELQPAPLPQQQGELLQCLQPALLLRQQGELLHCLQPALLLDMQQRRCGTAAHCPTGTAALLAHGCWGHASSSA